MSLNTIADDESRMAQALRLAELGLHTTDPNPRVGCVLWREGRVIGEGAHLRAGEPHAEVFALRAAGAAAAGATAYVTLEPCSHTGRTPPCADALIAAGVKEVHCASVDPNPRVAGAGLRRLEQAGVRVLVGTLAKPAHALNVGFFSRFERARPYVRLKLAMSLDARTAAAAPAAHAWITSEASRLDVQRWRARSSAVLTGAGTVRSDDPRLDVRWAYGPWVRQPLRVVLDPSLSCSPRARVFADGGAIVFAAAGDSGGGAGGSGAANSDASGTGGRAGSGATGGLAIERVAAAPGGLDLGAVLRRLIDYEVNELFVECGPRLAGAFLRARLVDELILYVAPHFLGMDAAPLAALSSAELTQVPPLEITDVRRIGADLRLILTPKGS
jgi:diaminohydroxyphosphoribosylaminopyrimidine deaminase/5-amino-6-(5-phosphoribosylamino)uracil reductase